MKGCADRNKTNNLPLGDYSHLCRNDTPQLPPESLNILNNRQPAGQPEIMNSVSFLLFSFETQKTETIVFAMRSVKQLYLVNKIMIGITVNTCD